jgi:DNA-binding CsgD family transcriptional regulator
MWQVFLDRLSPLVKLSSGYLLSGSEHEGFRILAGGGSAFNPETIRIYNDYYYQVDPFASPLRNLQPIALARGEQLVAPQQLHKTELYNDILRRNEMESMTLLKCSASPDHTDVLPLWRRSRDGTMDDDAFRLVEMLLPHVQTALSIKKMMNASLTAACVSNLALDLIPCAAFLVASNGRVQYMNQRAALALAEADGLRLDGGELTASARQDAERLRLAIHNASVRDTDRTHTCPGSAFLISCAKRHERLRVTVLPVPEKHVSATPVPGALVFVIDPGIAPKPRAHFMRMLYGLTPTESRLADLVLQGFEVRDAACRLHIALGTARFHLKRILSKTGTRRQGELIRLMLSLPDHQNEVAVDSLRRGNTAT